MATLAALQTAIANIVAEAEERIQDVERRITDAEAVLYEVTEQIGADDTRCEISCATV